MALELAMFCPEKGFCVTDQNARVAARTANSRANAQSYRHLQTARCFYEIIKGQFIK